MTDFENDLIDALREANTNLTLVLADVAELVRSRRALAEELASARLAWARVTLAYEGTHRQLMHVCKGAGYKAGEGEPS